MPFSTKLSHEERAAEILNAASKSFCHKGFHQTSMNDISRAAGISTGLIYHYFDSKNAIIQAMAEEHKRDLSERLDEARRADSLEDAVRTLFSRDCDKLSPQEQAALAVDLYGEARRNEHIAGLIRELEDYVRAELVSLIRHFQQRDTRPRATSPEAGARLLLTFHHGFLMEEIPQGNDAAAPAGEDYEKQLSQICDLLFSTHPEFSDAGTSAVS
jgi:AcrR family transcriptional regulator